MCVCAERGTNCPTNYVVCTNSPTACVSAERGSVCIYIYIYIYIYMYVYTVNPDSNE
jgi:hypothetical protein